LSCRVTIDAPGELSDVALALVAGQALAEKFQRALARQCRARRVVAAALVAIEAVVRRVEKELPLRVRGFDLRDVEESEVSGQPGDAERTQIRGCGCDRRTARGTRAGTP